MTLIKSCIDIAERWFNVVSTLDTEIVSMLYNVENPTSDFVSFSTFVSTLFECWNNVETMLIDVIWTVIHNVETTLIDVEVLADDD